MISIQEGKRAISSSVGGISPTSELSPVSVHTQISEPSDASSKGARQSQPTISKLPKRNVQIAIAVIDEHSFTRECITKSLRQRSSLLDIAAFAACDDCLRSPRRHDLILYHSHESVAKRINSQPVVNIKNLLEIAPVIVLCDVDSVESILAAFESGARVIFRQRVRL